jgi:hypothetical protein
LVVDETGVRMARQPERPRDPVEGPPGDADEDRREPEVTVVLSYEDAAAMSRGELDPIAALGSGRVRIRGDLSVLVAGQERLAAAASHLAALHQRTTY